MALPAVFEAFVKKSPLSVMVRGVLENLFSAERLDRVFDVFAERQAARKLLYSTCVELMIDVVTRSHRSLGAAIRGREPLLPVNRDAIYKKIAGVEPEVAAATVAVTAADAEETIRAMGGQLPDLAPGFRVRILDGNHLGATQHRLKPLRGLNLATLPGTCVALYDPALTLIADVFLLEDGHASERRTLAAIAARAKPDDLFLADRNFCTRQFARSLTARGAFFVFRLHKSNFPLEELSERGFVGDSPTGKVYEQQAVYRVDGETHPVRLITLELHEPMRDKSQLLQIVTNAPRERLPALAACPLYRGRWRIEDAFYELTVELRCEIDTLGYPQASLLAFCAAVLCLNAYRVAQAALRAQAGAERAAEFSSYYMAEEIAGVWRGMQIAIAPEHWAAAFAGLTPAELGQELLELAAQVNLRRYRKAPTRRKKPKLKGKRKRLKSKHASTAKILRGIPPK